MMSAVEYHPPVPASSHGWRKWKLALRAASSGVAIVMMIAVVWAAVEPNNYFSVWMSNVGALVLVGCWNAAEFITLYVRRRTPNKAYDGIHPGAHIALEFIIAGAAMWSFTSMTLVLAYTYYRGFSNTIVGREILTAICAGILSFIHLVLLVRACVETHILRKAGTASRTPVVPELRDPRHTLGGGLVEAPPYSPRVDPAELADGESIELEYAKSEREPPSPVSPLKTVPYDTIGKKGGK